MIFLIECVKGIAEMWEYARHSGVFRDMTNEGKWRNRGGSGRNDWGGKREKGIKVAS